MPRFKSKIPTHRVEQHLETSRVPLCATYNIVISYTHRDCNYILDSDCDLFVSCCCWGGLLTGGSADRSSCRHRWATPSRRRLATPPAAWRRRFGSRLHGHWSSHAYRHMEVSSKAFVYTPFISTVYDSNCYLKRNFPHCCANSHEREGYSAPKSRSSMSIRKYPASIGSLGPAKWTPGLTFVRYNSS